ncbi:hypothetical protein ACPCBF_25240 [Streptomyces pseudogriseolus]|uniref:hypothetical protein n=1 Tax=Streptomyces pseudogriseolus TaxID=36817 RepID=UPI003FA3400E
MATTTKDKKSETTTDTQTIDAADQRVQIGIDPAALIAAAKAASDADNKKTKKSKNDDETTIRAIPALVATTGTATTTAALGAGSLLGPVGLGAVAAGTAVITVGMLVSNRNAKKNNAKNNGGKNARTNARGAAGNINSSFGSGGGAGRRHSSGSGGGSSTGGGGSRRSGGGSSLLGSGSAGTGTKNRKSPSNGTGSTGHGPGGKHKNNHAGGGLGGGKGKGTGNGKGKGSYASTGIPHGAKAQRGADLLAARKNNGGNLNKKNKKNGLGNNTAGKGTTRAALKKAGASALKSTSRTLRKTPVGKLAKATSRGIGKTLGKPVRAMWNSNAGQNVRSAARRLGRSTKKNLVMRPLRATARALSKLWRRVRPGRGTYAHAARTVLIGAWAAVCSAVSLLLVFGWFRGKGKDGEPGAMIAERIARRVWQQLMKRSRKHRDSLRRVENMTMTVDDPGLDSSTQAAAAAAYVDPSLFELAAHEALTEYLEIETNPDMDRIAAEYRGLGDGIRSVRSAIAVVMEETDARFPLPKTIRMQVEELLGAIDQIASYADNFWVHFARVHAHDLNRYDNPRTNEPLWNVVPGRRRTDGGGVQDRPSQFAIACAKMPQVLSSWAPSTPAEAASEFGGIGASLHTIAAAVQRLRDDAATSQPVHASVPDHLNTLAQGLLSCASDAGRIAVAVRTHLENEARKQADASTTPEKTK